MDLLQLLLLALLWGASGGGCSMRLGQLPHQSWAPLGPRIGPWTPSAQGGRARSLDAWVPSPPALGC